MTISEEYNILPRVTYGSFVSFAQGIIVDILGEIPPEGVTHGLFSGGASTSRGRTISQPAGKYLGQADVTPQAFDYIQELLSECDLWSELRNGDNINVVEGNVLFTVLKNTEIDRCACKEPDFNMYMQKGVGDYIRSKLRRVGIDLNDQSRNRYLAKVGSQTNSLATLDLSSASDSICRELVFQLLPIHWFVLLDSIRSHKTYIDGDIHVNEMFSSMGNGFTFELESLLFYAIARTAAYFGGHPGIISVYGDDIIVPSPVFNDLVWCLSVFGFEVNTKKSFADGPFRESCGGHYHDGIDITPFYVKAPIQRFTDLIRICNQIRRWATTDGLDILDPRVYHIWNKLRAYVPVRFWGGHDVNYTGRLVSSHRPDRPVSLVSVTTNKENGAGGYLHWLDLRKSCSSGAIGETSITSLSSGIYREKKIKIHGEAPVTSHFLEEVWSSE